MSNVSYKNGSAKVKGMVEGIVQKIRGDLLNAKIRVIEASKVGRAISAAMLAAAPGDRVDGYDLVLLYDGGVFAAIDDAKGLAILDHAMADWEGVEKRGRKGAGVGFAYLRRSGIKVHLDVVKRHGAILADWSSVQDTFAQLSLPLEIKPPKLRKKTEAEHAMA